MKDEKEEIKPAPLGESSEEQKRVPKLVKWAKDGYPPIDLNGQYRHVVELIWHYIDMEKRSTSPTSEPPEEQEELCKFIKRNLNGHTEFRVVVLDDGKAYAHVLGRDSETFDFKI